MVKQLKPWEVEQLHQAGYGTHTEIMAREEFQDEPQTEKPKRKGKPINWEQVAYIVGVMVGCLIGIAIAFFILSAFQTAMDRLYWSVFPDGLEPTAVDPILGCLGFMTGFAIAINLVIFIVGKLK